MSVVLILLVGYQIPDDLPEYKFSRQILDDLNKDSTRLSRYQQASTDFSFIGNYPSALLYASYGVKKTDPLSNEDSLYFKQLKPVDAKTYILGRSKEAQVVIINEAHHNPKHRVFARSLLTGLFQQGFTYLGIEAFSYEDSLFHQRRYPLLQSGYYIREPQFGNLVRTALAIGFSIFPYEAQGMALRNGKDREIAQAKNIQQILSKNPHAKILLYVGYDHIREDSLRNSWGKAMAGRLKEFTGIDPLTIDQVEMDEKNQPNLENPYFKLTNNKAPTVYVSSTVKPFASSRTSNKFDVSVFHSRTKYIFGRPNWLLENSNKLYKLKRNPAGMSCPCLVFAFRQSEKNDFGAVPVDIIEITDKVHNKALVLPSGNYSIVIKNEKGDKANFGVKVKDK